MPRGQWPIKKFCRLRMTMYHSRVVFITNAHNKLYDFCTGIGDLLKNSEANRGGCSPLLFTFEYATARRQSFSDVRQFRLLL